MWPFQQKSKQTPSYSKRRRLGVEMLENRRLMAGVVYDSVASFGYSDTSSTQVQSIVHDQIGNSYTTGRFVGTVDFDPGEGTLLKTALGAHDAFVAKYDPAGNIVWVTQLGGTADNGAVGSDIGQDIAIGSNGNVFVSGSFYGYTQIGSANYTSLGTYDTFVARLDASGNILNSIQWGTAGSELVSSIDTDAAGNAYLTLGNDAINVVKFDATLQTKWTKTFGSYSSAQVNSDVDAAGNIYITGAFNGTVDFDPSAVKRNLSSGSSSATFMLKLDNNGAYKWASAFIGRNSGGTVGYSDGLSVAVDSTGSVVVAGRYSGSVDFDPGSGVTTLPAQSTEAYVAKLSSTGTLVWAKALQSDGGVTPYGLSVDSSNSIYAAGDFTGTIDLDPSATSFNRTFDGSTDTFVVKLSPSGSFVWGESISGAANTTQHAHAISVSNTGVVSIAGYFIGETDFDPDPTTSRLRTSGLRSSGYTLRLRQV